MANSLATTVATPAKWVGRARPSSGSDTSATVTDVRTAPSGYISSPDGTNSRSTPSRLGQGGVAVEVAGVGVEVLGRARTAAG